MAFKDVIGQQEAVRMLRGALSRQRVASAYLFAGDEGIGKGFTALNLIKALNCQSPVEWDHMPDACDRCPSCRKISSGSHADILTLAPENGVIKVEHVRALEEVLFMRSSEARVKAIVMREAHLMNPSAANALLKTLEEPPSGSILILTASRPDMLPLTIRSRCSRIGFKPLGVEASVKVLGPKAKDPELLARLSMGRPGLCAEVDLLKDRKAFFQSLGADASKAPWKDKEAMERWVELGLAALRDAAVLKETGSPDMLIHWDALEPISGLSKGASTKDILDAYYKLQQLRGQLFFNLNRGVVWNYSLRVLGDLNKNG